MAKAQANIRSLARAHTESAITVLAGIMNAPNAPESARVTAANSLMDRGWGKATQPISGDDTMDPIKLIVRKIVDADDSNS